MNKEDLKYNEGTYGLSEVSKNKTVKTKYQCNCCGHIDYLLQCPKCMGGMFKYKSRL